MSRLFDGVDDLVTFAPGAADIVQGPITIAALIKPTSGVGTRGILDGDSASDAVYALLIDSSQYYCARVFSTVQNSDIGDWQWVAFSKAAGASPPNWSYRNVTTAGAWVHTPGASNSSDGTGPIDAIRVGLFFAGGRYQGLVAALAVWNTNLNDGQIEAACTLQASDLASASPTWATLWNQGSVATPVPDFTGGGGDQTAITGTTVSADDPPGFNYALVTTVTGTAAAALGTVDGAAAGEAVHPGTGVADLGALGATASGLVTVTGAALSDLGRLDAIATTPLPPDPDQFVSVLAEQLLACLCEKAAAAEGAPAHCCFRVGTEIAHDAGMFEDLCCEGLAYVALGDTYPSSDSFPEADLVRQASASCAPTTWAQVFQVGIIRCVPTGTLELPPSCTEWNVAARQNIVDAKTLRQVACCIRNFVVDNNDTFLGMSLVIDRQIQGTPQGGCVERTMKITAQFPNICDGC